MTIVFGVIALGVTAALVEPRLGRELGTSAGALAFSTGLVFAVVGRIAEEIAAKGPSTTLSRAVLAGALITLLSYMMKAVDTVASRILLALMVGYFLAVGPFDHAVVSGLHLLYGVWHSDSVLYSDLWSNLTLSTAGDLLGGLLLITLTHTAQTRGR